jgi:hypothetical protein
MLIAKSLSRLDSKERVPVLVAAAVDAVAVVDVIDSVDAVNVVDVANSDILFSMPLTLL